MSDSRRSVPVTSRRSPSAWASAQARAAEQRIAEVEKEIERLARQVRDLRQLCRSAATESRAVTVLAVSRGEMGIAARANKLRERLEKAGGSELGEEVKRLHAALKPFADVSLPDNWPAGCVLTWYDPSDLEQPRGKHRTVASYLHIDAQGAPTIGDYRRAREAKGGGE